MRQGIKHSIVRYIGIVMGAVNILFFYPLFLGEEKLGLVSFIVQTSMLLQVFVALGITGVVTKFFPLFKDETTTHRGLLSFSLLWTILGSALTFSCIWIFSPFIIDFYSKKSTAYLQFLPFVIPLAFFIGLFNVLRVYANNFNRIVVPTILDQLYKFLLPILAGLYFSNFISFEYLMYGILIYYFLIIVFIVKYIMSLGEWKLTTNFSFISKDILRDMGYYAGYATFGSVGSLLAMRIDSFMVASISDLSNTGIYAVALFITNVIKVPGESIRSISGPIISKDLSIGNFEPVRILYKKSSIILWTSSLFLALLIGLSLDSLFEIMPRGDTFSKGKSVILILGIGLLFDMVTSVNGEIISYSKHFRFSFFAIIFLGILNVITNNILIPRYGINGAAMATTFSLVLFNSIKLIFVYFKFNMIPFSYQTIQVLVIGIITYFIVSSLPFVFHPIIMIIIKSLLISLLFLSSIIYLNVSDEITSIYFQLIKRLRSLISRKL